MEDYNYYKQWYNRYIIKWRKLIDLPNRTHKVKYLIQEIKYFIWMLELRKEYSYTHTGDLYDLFAIRIITDDVRHCYEILGVLHNVFVPMPHRFKDYIALPKEN